MVQFCFRRSWAILPVWLCFFGLCASLVAAPAAHYGVEKWTVADGLDLPSDIVISMTQTRDGYLWLGTFKGLARFDGVRFKKFDENNTPGLNGGVIVNVFEDTQSNLWVATQVDGVARVTNGRAIHLDLGGDNQERQMRSIAEDAGGRVWLNTADGLLVKYENGAIKTLDLKRFGPSVCRSLAPEKSGPLWVGFDRGQIGLGPDLKSPQSFLPATNLDYLLASKSGGYWRLADGRVEKWAGSRREKDLGPYPWTERIQGFITSACEDRDGDLVVGTRGQGIYWFDSEGKSTHFTSEQGLSHNYILCLCADRDGDLWAGTDSGGLDRLKPQAFEAQSRSLGLTVNSVCASPDGGIFFNTYSADGIVYAGQGTNWTIGPAQGLASVNIKTIFVDREHLGRMWVGTRDMGLFKSDTGAFSPEPAFGNAPVDVSVIFQDSGGSVWVGARQGLSHWDGKGWKIFTTASGLPANAISALADDGEGGVWIGTDGGGMARLSGGKFILVGKADGLPSGHVSALYRDADGALWVATDGGGLGRYKDGKWKRYTTRDGLASNSIGYILEDKDGYLWLGSNAGLMRVKKTALNDFVEGDVLPCRVYSEADGLPTRQCSEGSQPAACVTRDGRLWFPTIRGLASVNPRDLHSDTNPPPVVIESVLIDRQSQSADGPRAEIPGSIIVPAGRESVDIQYTSPDLGAASKSRDTAHFKYRLETEGREAGWIDAGDSTVAHFPKLTAGQYGFHVIARNEDGLWNDVGASLAITVLPPFWQTWWFIITMILLLGGLIAAVVHYLSTQKLQRQLALEKDRQRIARDIHDQLGASLTHVALLGELVESDKDSPKDIEEHARQISQTARDTSKTLDEIVWAVNPSNDTLDSLVTYFCKQAQEYLEAAGMRYRLEVPPNLPATPLRPELRHNVFMAAKEAVTNVARHSGGNTVWIRLRLEPGKFVLEIEDNGKGMEGMDEKHARTRNGLTNMRKRMEETGGEFSIGKGAEGGTLVRLSAPLTS